MDDLYFHWTLLYHWSGGQSDPLDQPANNYLPRFVAWPESALLGCSLKWVKRRCWDSAASKWSSGVKSSESPARKEAIATQQWDNLPQIAPDCSLGLHAVNPRVVPRPLTSTWRLSFPLGTHCGISSDGGVGFSQKSSQCHRNFLDHCGVSFDGWIGFSLWDFVWWLSRILSEIVAIPSFLDRFRQVEEFVKNGGRSSVTLSIATAKLWKFVISHIRQQIHERMAATSRQQWICHVRSRNRLKWLSLSSKAQKSLSLLS
jgi:hypothetical protein